jgi:uncharacterized protein (DUF1501 family)
MCGDGDFNRREFVRLGLAGVGAGFLGGVGLPDMAFAAAGGAKTLIWIDMFGGSDGLHLFPPISGSNRSAYATARGALAIEAPNSSNKHAALKLNERWGMNPNLAPLLPLWDAGQMAVCIGTNGDTATMSHFDAQRWIRLGAERRLSGRGVLAGYLEEKSVSGASALRGLLSGGANMRVSFQGGPPVPAINDASRFKIRNEDWCAGTACSDNRLTQALNKITTDPSSGVMNAKEAELLMRTRSVERSMVASLDMVKDAAAAYPGPANGFTATGLGNSLKLIAQLLKKGAPLEVAGLDWSGFFDMHTSLVTTGGVMYDPAKPKDFHSYVKGLYDGARDLKLFCDEMGPEAMKDIVILVSTEFGRRIGTNGAVNAPENWGTDHGIGASWFLIGGGVQGKKIYGDEPNLDIAALQKGKEWHQVSMPILMNYKDIIGEILTKHLKLDENRLPNLFPNRTVKFKTHGLLA